MRQASGKPSCPEPEPPRDGATPTAQPVGGVRWLLRFRITGSASWHFRWCQREHRGARPQEMDRSRSVTAQAGAAKAVTATPTEPSLADQIARPRAVAIDPAGCVRGPTGRASAQRRPSTWFSRPHKNVTPTEPTVPDGPEGMVIGPGIGLPADPPGDYLIEVPSPVGIRGLESGSRALTALRDSGAVLVNPLMGPALRRARKRAAAII